MFPPRDVATMAFAKSSRVFVVPSRTRDDDRDSLPGGRKLVRLPLNHPPPRRKGGVDASRCS